MYSFESRKELYFFGDNGRKLKQRILAIELQKKNKKRSLFLGVGSDIDQHVS